MKYIVGAMFTIAILPLLPVLWILEHRDQKRRAKIPRYYLTGQPDTPMVIVNDEEFKNVG